MAIPRHEKAVWNKQTFWLFVGDIGSGIGVAIIGATTVLRLWAEGRTTLAGLSAFGAVAVLAFTGLRAVLQYRDRARNESPHDLTGCLQTLRGALEASDDGRPGLRITLFVPVNSGTNLEQVCDYACSDHARCRGTAGRTVASTTGVIGRAFQTENCVVAQRVSDDPEEHIRDLVNNWGFSVHSARRVDPTVRAWMAVLLRTPERGVEAIVYSDAQSRDFFNEPRQALVLGGCAGLALFVRQRYN
jgi:hypothetical protein